MKRRKFLTAAGIVTAAAAAPSAAIAALSVEPKKPQPDPKPRHCSIDPKPADQEHKIEIDIDPSSSRPFWRPRFEQFYSLSRRIPGTCGGCTQQPCMHCGCAPCSRSTRIANHHCPLHPVRPYPLGDVPCLGINATILLSKVLMRHRAAVEWLDYCRTAQYQRAERYRDCYSLNDATLLVLRTSDELVLLANENGLGVYWGSMARTNPQFYSLPAGHMRLLDEYNAYQARSEDRQI